MNVIVLHPDSQVEISNIQFCILHACFSNLDSNFFWIKKYVPYQLYLELETLEIRKIYKMPMCIPTRKPYSDFKKVKKLEDPFVFMRLNLMSFNKCILKSG